MQGEAQGDYAMTTKEDVESAFRADLQALLDKYEAELEVTDYRPGYDEKDVWITVRTQSGTEIHLGAWITGKPGVAP